jgi:hypothetical protein
MPTRSSDLLLINNSKDEDFQELLLHESTPVDLDDIDKVIVDTCQKKVTTLLKIRRRFSPALEMSVRRRQTYSL